MGILIDTAAISSRPARRRLALQRRAETGVQSRLVERLGAQHRLEHLQHLIDEGFMPLLAGGLRVLAQAQANLLKAFDRHQAFDLAIDPAIPDQPLAQSAVANRPDTGRRALPDAVTVADTGVAATLSARLLPSPIAAATGGIRG